MFTHWTSEKKFMKLMDFWPFNEYFQSEVKKSFRERKFSTLIRGVDNWKNLNTFQNLEMSWKMF